MDPWCATSSAETDVSFSDNSFQDSFCDFSLPVKCEIPALPNLIVLQNEKNESEEYLSKLENKLKKLQKEKLQPTALTAKKMLASLHSKKESYFEQTLNEHSNMTSPQDGTSADLYWDGGSETEKGFSTEIKRKLQPDQQAINPIELLELLKHDVLLETSNSVHPSDPR